MGRILGVDPGEKNIGLALSDPTGMISTPLRVIKHVSRNEDAKAIAGIATENEALKIVIGQALGSEGEVGPAAVQSERLADCVRQFFSGEVILWDESGSTNAVKDIYLTIGVRKNKRRGHLDARAAAYILQDYLNWQFDQKPTAEANENDGSF